MSNSLRLRSLLAVGASASAIMMAAPAVAQDGSTATEQLGGNTVEEVVVTAEKREESLQDVPVAISAFTDEKRDVVGITTIQDMTNFTPGLQYSSQTDRTSLRGVGRLTNVRTAEGGVAIYSDGVYTTSTVEAGKSPLFVDRVEVLRGPQGTLYGRNSISGAINVISKRPTPDWYAEVRGQVGNYGRHVIEGAVSGPTGIEGLEFRLTGSWEKQDEGWYDNVVPGMPDEGNVINQTIFEGQLQYQPTDRLEIWAKFSTIEWNNGGGGPGARNSYTPSPYPTYQVQNSGIIINPGYACNGAATGLRAVTSVVNLSPYGCVNPETVDERKFASQIPYKVHLDDTYIFATEVSYDFDAFSVKYIGGAVNYHYFLEGPYLFAGTAAPIQQFTLPTILGTPGLVVQPRYGFNYEEDINWQSHEVNFASNGDGPFQWLAGLYYFDEDDEQPVNTTMFDQPQASGPFALPGTFCFQTGGVCAPQIGRRIYDSRPEGHIESKAVYGQIDWEFMPTFTLTAGLRYTDDSKKGREEVRVNCYGVAACYAAPELLPFLGPTGVPLVDLTQIPTITYQPPADELPEGVTSVTTFDPDTGRAMRTFAKEWDAVTGTLGLQWEPDGDTNLYARYSRGFKAGGFRVGIDTALGPNPLSKEEYGDSVEAGVKKTLLDGQLQVNATVFNMVYQNAQVPLSIVNTSGGLTTNQAVLFNVDEAVSRGLEFETTWQPLDNLQILFNYSYLDTEITEGSTVDPADPAALLPGADPILTPAQCAEVVDGATRCQLDIFTAGQPNGGFQRFQNLEGNRLPNAPLHKVALNANYAVPTSVGTFIASASYIWRDEQYGSVFTRDEWKSPAYDQVDARLIYRAPDERFTAILFGRNLFDEVGYEGGAGAFRMAGYMPSPAAPPTFVATTPVTQGIATTYPLTPPRTFGIELQYKFF